jgi:hypothetical protein
VSATKDLAVQETAGGSGKWKQRGVPHKGWTCVDVQDLGAPEAVCEMCEIIPIRYVHVMEHEDYDGQLGVGCVCAQHMEEDRVGPKRRERLLINAAKRRQKWLTRKWRESRKGNAFLNTRGFNVVVYPMQVGWSFHIAKPHPLAGYIAEAESKKWTPRRRYKTEDGAKLGAFDMLELIRAGEL